MLSTVATLALSFGLAQSVAVSLFPKAELTTSAIANSTTDFSATATSTCPDYVTTSTTTESGTGTIYEWVTVTAAPYTHVITLHSYVTTISSSLGPVDTETALSYTGTTTATYYDYVTVGACTSTATA